MRLIDADELKEEISSHFDLELEPVIEKEVLRMIDEQETISAASPKWISVKDRLPEDDGEVLACNGKDVFIAHCEGEYWAVYLLNTEDDCYEQHVVKVTHWMPLPEPPEVKKMTIYEYKFQDGTTFKLLDSGFSGNEIFKLSDLHGKIILIRSYTLVKDGGIEQK